MQSLLKPHQLQQQVQQGSNAYETLIHLKLFFVR